MKVTGSSCGFPVSLLASPFPFFFFFYFCFGWWWCCTSRCTKGGGSGRVDLYRSPQPDLCLHFPFLAIASHIRRPPPPPICDGSWTSYRNRKQHSRPPIHFIHCSEWSVPRQHQPTEPTTGQARRTIGISWKGGGGVLQLLLDEEQPEIRGLIYFWCGLPLMANIYPVYSDSIYIHPNLWVIIYRYPAEGQNLNLLIC